MNEKEFKEKIAAFLNCSPDSIFFYWKGRVALYTILKAIGVKPGDEVLLPGFTCVVVPNAIIYTGAKPVYVDISAGDYNMDINKLKKSITSKTKAILCQNTFGLSANVEEIIDIAKKNNLFTIEDCTHGFGGLYNGRPNGSYCDAAFFSTQWNKPFSTGIGGFAVINNKELLDKLHSLDSEKIKPDFKDKVILSFLIFFRKYFINDHTQIFLVNLFRILSKYNIVVGSNQGIELSSTKMPEGYQKDISSVQLSAGIKNIKKLPALNRLRKINAASYSEFLRKNNRNYVPESQFKNHLFLKYPLLAKDRDKFFRLAKKSGIVLGDWFLSPLHPVQHDLEKWGFEEKSCPIAVEIAAKIVNLPTDIKDIKKVLVFLQENLDQIE